MRRLHVSTSIDGLLALRDNQLSRMLNSIQDENGEHPTLTELKKYDSRPEKQK